MLGDYGHNRTSHMALQSARGEPEVGSRFGAASPLGEGFVDRVLARNGEYDPEMAYLLSVISGWAYTDAAALSKQLKFYGMGGAIVDEITVRNDVMYIVATAYLIRSQCGRLGVLAFRGTEPTNLINWLTDADVSMRSFGTRGKVHRGFYVNLRSLWEDISAKLDDALTPTPSATDIPSLQPLQRLYVTGHSLGGAMAVLAAARILNEAKTSWHKVLHGVYTFGQPAVGDLKFVAQYQRSLGAMLFRHTYKLDAVPRLPPASSGTFGHLGEERICVSVDAGWELNDALLPQARFIAVTIASVVGSFVLRRIPMLTALERWLFKYSLLDDHSPSNYIEVSRASMPA